MEGEDLARLVRFLPDAVVVLGADGSLRWGNPAAERIFGLSLEQVQDTPATDLVHPDDLASVLLALETVQDKVAGSPIEIRVRAADGWRLVELIGSPTVDDEIVLCLRDLTERRRFEVAYDEEARFRSLVHNSGAVTMLVSGDGVIESASGAITRLTGRDQLDLEHQPIEALVVDDAEGRRLRDALSEAHAGEPSTIVVNAAGELEPVPMELTIVNLLDDPTVGGFVVSGHEVSERVAVERELRSALSLLHATLESTADGILVVDCDGSITSFNERFVEMWHIPRAVLDRRDDTAAIGHVLGQLAHPEDFASKVDELYADPEAESYDMLEFLDGRVFERLSRPQRVDGEVVGRVWSFRDLTQRKRLEDELVYQAFHDQLTGLANKARFCDRLQHASERSRRTATGFAVLFLDIDDFKRVNDSLGHQAGDQLLISAAEVLTGSLRVGDTPARLGGDEFAVLVEDVQGEAEVTALAARITESFRRPFHIANRDVFATVSVGIAFGSRRSTTEEILRDADLAMYTAKSRGKNRYELFAVEQHAAAVIRVEVEADLHRALDHDELVVFYQPMVDARTERTVAVEALVRWEHPERGMLLPGMFIPLAEEAGLMDAIGRSILEQACRQTREWQRGSWPDLRVSVNVSPRQLAGDRIVETVADTLARTGLAPESLILEITETAMMRDTQTSSRNLHGLKELGVGLALDDFGTGYSSLTYLQQFPIDIVKIDKSFVATLDSGVGNSLAPAIIQLAQSLGLTTVAEGVEQPGQLRRLRELGCDLVQGFLLARPQPGDAFTARFEDPGNVVRVAS